ncbi:MAG TPA: hypothetical protein VES68_03225, partial [Candidatus Sulfotelmatobacter sp.]|nr:hypothetical protein [Candidatus Sulfotelmatobacter sp.]
MDTNNLVGELIEKGQSTAKTTISDTANSVSNQIGIKKEPNVSGQQQIQPQPAQGTEQIQNSRQNDSNSEFTKEMVEDFYSPSVSTPQISSQQEEEAQTQRKLAEVRQKIYQERHNEVYFNAVLNADASKKQEERPAERVERQKMEDLQIEQKKKQDELPRAVIVGQTH